MSLPVLGTENGNSNHMNLRHAHHRGNVIRVERERLFEMPTSLREIGGNCSFVYQRQQAPAATVVRAR